MSATLRIVLAIALPGVCVGAVWAAAQPRAASPSPLNLGDVATNQDPTVRNQWGRALFYDFGPVEATALYHGTGFPQNAESLNPDPVTKVLPTLSDEAAFEYLRKLNVHHVVALQDNIDSFFAEQGYFKFWTEKTGYWIDVTWLAVQEGHEYETDDRSGLHAAGEFLTFVQQPHDGAIFVHDDGRGTDATGIVVAAYELWRNQRWVERDTLWEQVSNRRPRDTRLNEIRSQLEFLAQL